MAPRPSRGNDSGVIPPEGVFPSPWCGEASSQSTGFLLSRCTSSELHREFSCMGTNRSDCSPCHQCPNSMEGIMNRAITTTLATLGAIVLFACGDAAIVVEPVLDDTFPETATGADRECEPGEQPTPLNPCVPRPGGIGEPLPRHIASGWSLDDCENTALGGGDTDGDGLNDQCESELAEAFAPAMMIDPDDNVNRDEYYVVMPGSGNSVMIFYAFGYHVDLGKPNPPLKGYKAHKGDSEFVIFQIVGAVNRGDPWGLLYAYLSAHRGEGHGFNSSTLAGGWNLETDSNGRPLVWIAMWKHANYISRDACNKGANRADDCSGNTNSTRFGVYSDGNLGQTDARTHTTCAVPSRHSELSGRGECYWTSDTFYGWQIRTGEGAGAYADHLSDFDFDKRRATILS